MYISTLEFFPVEKEILSAPCVICVKCKKKKDNHASFNLSPLWG